MSVTVDEHDSFVARVSQRYADKAAKFSSPDRIALRLLDNLESAEARVTELEAMLARIENAKPGGDWGDPEWLADQLMGAVARACHAEQQVEKLKAELETSNQRMERLRAVMAEHE